MPGRASNPESHFLRRLREIELDHPGLAEGVQLLQGGGKALIFIPPALSFGDGPWPDGVPRGMPLGFFLELHEIIPAE